MIHLTSAEHAELIAARTERDRLLALLNTPETARFLEGTRIEVAHQVDRWGTVHDRAKEPADWYWLVGYLAGKALAAHQDARRLQADLQAEQHPCGRANLEHEIEKRREKALHHTISSAAALANWHAHITLGAGSFTPGASDLQRFLTETFGETFAEGAAA